MYDATPMLSHHYQKKKTFHTISHISFVLRLLRIQIQIPLLHWDPTSPLSPPQLDYAGHWPWGWRMHRQKVNAGENTRVEISHVKRWRVHTLSHLSLPILTHRLLNKVLYNPWAHNYTALREVKWHQEAAH